MIKQNRNLYVSHLDKINCECLKISSVWYQYYEPYELDYLESIGFDKVWAFINFVAELPNEEMDIQYAIKDHQLLNREFTFIQCKIVINPKCKLKGYAFKINNEVNAITVSHENIEFDFLNPIVFADENSSTMKSLKQKSGRLLECENKLILEYEKENRDFFNLKQEFQIY